MKKFKTLRTVLLSGFILLGTKISMAMDQLDLRELNLTLKSLSAPVLNQEEILTFTESVNKVGAKLTKDIYYSGCDVHIPNGLCYRDMAPVEVISLTTQILKDKQPTLESPIFTVMDCSTWIKSIPSSEVISEQLRNFLVEYNVGNIEEITEIKPKGAPLLVNNLALMTLNFMVINRKFQDLCELGNKVIFEFIADEMEQKRRKIPVKISLAPELKKSLDFIERTTNNFLKSLKKTPDRARPNFWRLYNRIQNIAYNSLLDIPKWLALKIYEYTDYESAIDNSSDDEEDSYESSNDSSSDDN